jgi:hypothetical protein
MKDKFYGMVAMHYLRGDGADVYHFQLVRNGVAVAILDQGDTVTYRYISIPELATKRKAIERLARMHHRKSIPLDYRIK